MTYSRSCAEVASDHFILQACTDTSTNTSAEAARTKSVLPPDYSLTLRFIDQPLLTLEIWLLYRVESRFKALRLDYM
jgi:hypothetical protein